MSFEPGGDGTAKSRSDEVPSGLRRFFVSLWALRVERQIGVVCLVIVGMALLTLSAPLARMTKRALGVSSLAGEINEQLNPFRTRQTLLSCGLPIYDLKIKPEGFRSILGIVEQAKLRGGLSDDLKQWVKATFVYGGMAREVKIRVRGDNAEHWSSDRCSWRIRFPEDQPLEGRREINLIVSTDGKSITERFTNAVFRRLGMVTLRDRYVVLRLNGIPQGVYYEVEHWDAPLLAHHQRSESTIFRHPQGGSFLGAFNEQITEDARSAWTALQRLLDFENEPTAAHFQAALAVTDVEDYLKFIAGTTLFCADHTSFVTDNHRLYFDQSRGTFSRIPWDLEPTRIPTIERFDLGDWHSTIDVFARWPMSRFQVAVLEDPSLRLRRNRILWSLVRDDSLLELFDATYRDIDVAFWADVMSVGNEEDRLTQFRSLVHRNSKIIRRVLHHCRTGLTVTLEQPARIRLDFAVDNVSGIRMKRIRLKAAKCEPNGAEWSSAIHPDTYPSRVAGRFALYRDENGNGELDPTDPWLGESTESGAEAILELESEWLASNVEVAENYPAYVFQSETSEPRYKTQPLRTIVFPKSAKHTYFLTRSLPPHTEWTVWPQVIVEAQNAVTDEPLTPDDLPVRVIDRAGQCDEVRRTADFSPRGLLNLKNQRGLEAARIEVSESLAGATAWVRVSLPAGTHRIDGTVVIPERTNFRIEAGARLEMGPGASIVSFGTFQAEGRPEAPIEIVAGGPWAWDVVAVVDAERESVFRHVYLSGGGSLDGVTEQGIFFTGALAVHHGDAMVEHCRITSCTAEDGLNIKHGRVTLRDTRFADNLGDGADLDFVSGEVSTCQFSGNRGDGLDLSGSTLTIRGCRLTSSGDKGISVGEQSNAAIIESELEGNSIGIAVKDLSDARIEDCRITGNGTGVAAYRKKPIFGGGRAGMTRCELFGNREETRADSWSRIEISETSAAARP